MNKSKTMLHDYGESFSVYHYVIRIFRVKHPCLCTLTSGTQSISLSLHESAIWTMFIEFDKSYFLFGHFLFEFFISLLLNYYVIFFLLGFIHLFKIFFIIVLLTIFALLHIHVFVLCTFVYIMYHFRIR